MKTDYTELSDEVKNWVRRCLRDDIEDCKVELWDDYGFEHEETRYIVFSWVKHYLGFDDNG